LCNGMDGVLESGGFSGGLFHNGSQLDNLSHNSTPSLLREYVHVKVSYNTIQYTRRYAYMCVCVRSYTCLRYSLYSNGVWEPSSQHVDRTGFPKLTPLTSSSVTTGIKQHLKTFVDHKQLIYLVYVRYFSIH